jgi:hypothetical protein
MSSVVRLYDRFQRWTEELPRAQYAILLGLLFFVVWVALGVLFGELSLIAAVSGAIGAAGAFYWFDPR